MTSISENIYIVKLADIASEYNSTYHSTIKIKSIDVKSSTYIDFHVENNVKNPKFEASGNAYGNMEIVWQKLTLKTDLKSFM